MTILNNTILSQDNLKSFCESLHALRANKKFGIEKAAQLANCSVEKLDSLERGQAEIDVKLLNKLFEIYETKLLLGVESYDNTDF